MTEELFEIFDSSGDVINDAKETDLGCPSGVEGLTNTKEGIRLLCGSFERMVCECYDSTDESGLPSDVLLRKNRRVGLVKSLIELMDEEIDALPNE